MPNLRVEGLPSGDSGRQLVRLNRKYREGIARYGIIELTNNANDKSVKVLVLGNDGDNSDATILMPYDIRTALGVAKSGMLDFAVRRVGWIGKLQWYVTSPDPAVHVPAWIAVIGLLFAVAGIGVGVLPLLCS